MISLFIDTSFSDVSIALVKGGKLLSLIHEDIPNKHSIYVTKYIDNILKDNNLSPNSVDEIIIVNGPGSFTGIRIGVTIAKTYAYLLKKRIVPISSLLARALGEKEKYVLSLIDAGHSNYYIGLYDENYNIITEEFANSEKTKELIKKYNPKIVNNNDKNYDIEKIIKYTRQKEGLNPHAVNPIYLKMPEAMEKKCLEK